MATLQPELHIYGTTKIGIEERMIVGDFRWENMCEREGEREMEAIRRERYI